MNTVLEYEENVQSRHYQDIITLTKKVKKLEHMCLRFSEACEQRGVFSSLEIDVIKELEDYKKTLKAEKMAEVTRRTC